MSELLATAAALPTVGELSRLDDASAARLLPSAITGLHGLAGALTAANRLIEAQRAEIAGLERYAAFARAALGNPAEYLEKGNGN